MSELQQDKVVTFFGMQYILVSKSYAIFAPA